MSSGEIPRDAREVYRNAAGEPIAYTPYEGLGLLDLRRAELFALNRARLEVMAHRALARGLAPDAFVVVCIDADDVAWASLVEILMPGTAATWAQIRSRGEKPVARGSAMRAGLVELLEQAAPAAARDLRGRVPSPVAIDALVFALGGVSAFVVRPRTE